MSDTLLPLPAPSLAVALLHLDNRLTTPVPAEGLGGLAYVQATPSAVNVIALGLPLFAADQLLASVRDNAVKLGLAVERTSDHTLRVNR